MRSTMKLGLLAAVAAVMMPGPALAYIGPGLGAGAMAVVIGILGSIVMAVVAVIYYPVKRVLKARRAKAAEEETGTS